MPQIHPTRNQRYCGCCKEHWYRLKHPTKAETTTTNISTGKPMAALELSSMKNEVVIVTGAAGGLGCELARVLAAADANVVLVDINETGLTELSNELTSQGLSADAKVCDITNSQSIEKLVRDIDSQYQRIDGLVNCAGILGSNDYMFNIEADEWDAVMRINLKATWQMSTCIAA